jgi:hypothetical protein
VATAGKNEAAVRRSVHEQEKEDKRLEQMELPALGAVHAIRGEAKALLEWTLVTLASTSNGSSPSEPNSRRPESQAKTFHPLSPCAIILPCTYFPAKFTPSRCPHRLFLIQSFNAQFESDRLPAPPSH